jgi:hypothetical protein
MMSLCFLDLPDITRRITAHLSGTEWTFSKVVF